MYVYGLVGVVLQTMRFGEQLGSCLLEDLYSRTGPSLELSAVFQNFVNSLSSPAPLPVPRTLLGSTCISGLLEDLEFLAGGALQP